MNVLQSTWRDPRDAIYATQSNAGQCQSMHGMAKQRKAVSINAKQRNAMQCKVIKVQRGPGQNVTGIKIAIGFSKHRGRRRQGVPRMARRRFLDASDALWWRWCRDAPVATRAQARNSCQSRVVQEAATSTPENDASI